MNVQRALAHIGARGYALDLWLVGNGTMGAWNRSSFGISKPTDVLTFPFREPLAPGAIPPPRHGGDKRLGDIALNMDWCAARTSARKPVNGAPALAPFGSYHRLHTTADLSGDDVAWLLVAHGIAHIVGYDHDAEDDAKQMMFVEERLWALRR